MSSLLRSTKFVRYFTGAARTLILNSAKNAEANTLLNPKALCSVNNVVMRDYATTKKTETLEPLLQKLDLEVRRFGRITKRDIDEVFDELQGNNDITSSQSLLVIRCCGELVPEELPEQRTLLVQKIWSVLTERGVPMDISHYNALLRVYLENEHPFSPAKFLEELEKKGLQPNRVTYQRLMWRYCQEGDVEGATKVLERMRELNLPVSEPVLNALVMGHAFHGDTDGAKAVLETMAGAGLQPTNRTYTLLACGYAKKGDVDGLQNIIKAATEKDVYMTDKDILEVIEHLTLGGHGDKAEQLFSHLQKGTGYNQDVCNLILRLLNKGHEETAKKIMKTMPKTTTLEDSPFKGAFFIKQLLRLNKSPDHLIKTCRELQEENLVPNALYIATEGALQHGHTELAQKLFKELQKDGLEIRQHFYWPLLARKGKEGDEEGLLQIIRHMVAEGAPPTGEALRDYVLPYMIGKDSEENIILKLQIANVPVIHCARNLMVELMDAGKFKKAAEIAVTYRPRGQYSLINRPLLNVLSKTKDINSFATILHVISSHQPQNEDDSAGDEPQSDDKVDSNEIGRIVKTAVKNLSDPNLCENLLRAIHSKGLRISTESAEVIEQFLGQSMTTTLSELLAQLTSIDLEPIPLESSRRTFPIKTAAQLEQLIVQMKNKGGTNLNRLQKHLLSAYIKENNIEKVDDFLSELKKTNFELTVATLAQLHEFYCMNDNIEKAKECAAEIAEKHPDFELNKFKLIQMAYALIRTNKFDEACQFLTENKAKDDSDIKSFIYNSKCWQMLNHLAEEKNDVRVKEMTKLLVENNFIEPSNVLFGPSIKVYLLKDDIEGALTEFETCCKNYRITPWKGELMKALIMKEDASKLQWLADLSTQIHGEVNILHDLVLAFVECGRLRQARRILETPGLHTRQRRLEDACLRYVEEGKSEHLEGLLEATKELSHIDRSNIFYHLLVSYCNLNETDKALGLWTVLQEEGEVPSDQFLLYLEKHLKSKGKEVPFVIPENKTKIISKVKQEENVDRHALVTPDAKPKSEFSEEIETLVREGKSGQAIDIVLKSVSQNGVLPKANVIKFLLRRLADDGNAEKIELLGRHLHENAKRNVRYEDNLTLAVCNSGASAQHMDDLLRAVSLADSAEAMEAALKKFPHSGSLAMIMRDDQLIDKCHKIAEIALSKGLNKPANLLWMEYIISGKDKEADSLWKYGLDKANMIMFRRLMQESHIRGEPELIEKLISVLKTNKNITMGSIGNAYSRLISSQLSAFNMDKALAAFEEAIKFGVATTEFNKTTLEKLKKALEIQGKEFPYSIN